MFLFLMSMMLNIQPTVIWHQTVIEIPLYEEVEPYFLEPYVTITFGDLVVETVNVSYERGVNRTFLSVVNSNQLKSFYIDYRVYLLDYGVIDTHTIEFKIVDLEPPTIVWMPNLEIEVGAKLPKYETLIQIKDNYDETDQLLIHIDTSFVNVERVGNYPIWIELIDTSYNVVEYVFDVVVYDRKSPIIEPIKPLVINIDIDVNYNDYFKFSDNSMSQLKVLYELEKGLKEVGQDILNVCVSDESNNMTCDTYEVIFIDITPPQLVVISYIPEVEVFTSVEMIDYHQWITYMNDNVTDNEHLTLKILSDLNLNQIGKYFVTYELIDGALNKTTKSIQVEVVDKTPPEVMLLLPLTIEVHQTPNYHHFFQVNDNWTPIHQIKISYHTLSQYDQIGTFQLEVKVKDTHNNEKSYFYELEVVDTTPPLILSEDTLFIFDFIRPNYDALIYLKDNYDAFHLLTIQINDDHINYFIPGSYEIEVLAIDSSNNQSKAIIQVILMDIIPPIITLYETRIDLQLNGVMPIWTNYIKEVTDNATSLNLNDVIITHSVNMSQIGLYEVMYEVQDDALNHFKTILKLYVNDEMPPIISSQPLYIHLGQSYDLFEGLVIKDDLSTQIIIQQDDFNYAQPGTYEVVYYVYDERGNYTTHYRMIIVEDSSIYRLIKDYLPIVIVASLSVLISFFLYQKYHKINFDKHSMIKYNEFEETIEGE